MAKSNSFSKREIEKNKQQRRKEKRQRREARRNLPKDTFEDMIAYVDVNGRLTDTPPEEQEVVEIELADIEVSTPPKEDRNDQYLKGRIEFFNEEKGYGFIKHVDSVNKYFFHISNAPENIAKGNKVIFELEHGRRGLNAHNVVLAN